MPQLVPFYFMNLLTFGIVFLTLIIYIVSVYVLPHIVKLLLARMIIVKLS